MLEIRTISDEQLDEKLFLYNRLLATTQYALSRMLSTKEVAKALRQTSLDPSRVENSIMRFNQLRVELEEKIREYSDKVESLSQEEERRYRIYT